MSEKITSEKISRRRAFSLVGLAAAMGLAVPATMLTVSDAEAQTRGMQRREERRLAARSDVRNDVQVRSKKKPSGCGPLAASTRKRPRARPPTCGGSGRSLYVRPDSGIVISGKVGTLDQAKAEFTVLKTVLPLDTRTLSMCPPRPCRLTPAVQLPPVPATDSMLLPRPVRFNAGAVVPHRHATGAPALGVPPPHIFAARHGVLMRHRSRHTPVGERERPSGATIRVILAE